MPLRVGITVLLALFLADARVIADEAPLDPVQRDVQTIVRALYGGDLDTVPRFTHPTIIRMMGGPQAAREATQIELQRILTIGIRLESLSVPRPPEFLEGGGRRFAIVPTLTTVSAVGQRVESLNYQLGVREPGSTSWVYVEGSRVNNENVQVLFPGFPQDYEFPKTQRRKF